jgi:hypothetical protein
LCPYTFCIFNIGASSIFRGAVILFWQVKFIIFVGHCVQNVSLGHKSSRTARHFSTKAPETLMIIFTKWLNKLLSTSPAPPYTSSASLGIDFGTIPALSYHNVAQATV